MKKLHSLAFSVLAISVMTIGASPVFAQLADAPPADREQTITSVDQDARVTMPPEEREGPSVVKPAPRTSQNYTNNQRPGQSGTTTSSERNQSQTATDRQSTPNASQTGADRSNSSMQNRGYMASAPASGSQASNLIGAGVTTTGGENVGPVSDLIIDQHGQIVAIVVGVGGFLGMGEKDVAISWDDVTKTGTGDKQELRVNVTREALKAAPKFEHQG